MDVLSTIAIPCIDEALTLNPPKLLLAAAVRSLSTTEVSDTLNANSRARSTMKLPQLQVQRQSEETFCIPVFYMIYAKCLKDLVRSLQYKTEQLLLDEDL